MTRKELLEYLKGAKWNGAGYHESDDVMDAVREVVESYGSPDEDVDGIEDFEDDMMEVADSNTPIYNKDLAEWFGWNWSAVDEYHEEMGDDTGDIMRTIMGAYCMTLERAMREALEHYIDEYKEEHEEE